MAKRETILTAGDHALVQLARWGAPLLRVLGELEDEFFAKKLSEIKIEKPVFVTGLARSGTTMMLTLLSHADGVATHRYRDFPLLFTPLAWNWFQDRVGAGAGEARERPHRDRIRITKDSADAFEEPLWQAFFRGAHDAARCHVLGADTRNEAFEACFSSHLRKILHLRGGSRYISKGNYNVARIGYLARLFPDARFVIPVRDPLSHVASLVKQHALFCRYAAGDRRVGPYLEAAGHYEFGPQRRPINLDPARIGEIEWDWRAGDDYGGYARQWAQVYAHVERLRRDPALAGRVMVVRYEDACARPQALYQELMAFCGLSDAAGKVAAAAATLSAGKTDPIAERDAHTIWSHAGKVASLYAYEPPLIAKAA